MFFGLYRGSACHDGLARDGLRLRAYGEAREQHGDIARIEINRAEFARIVRPEIADDLTTYMKQLGFRYVTLDLGGYEQGSMNKPLPGVEVRKPGE